MTRRRLARWIVAGAIVVGSAGCQSCIGISDDPRVVSTDAATDTTTNADADAEAAAPTCDFLTPFDQPFRISELSSEGYERGLRLLPDELTAYFARTPPDSGNSLRDADLYVAKRSDVIAAFGSGQALRPEFNDNAIVGNFNPSPTRDGTELFFDSYRELDGGGSVSPRSIYRIAMKPTIGKAVRVPFYDFLTTSELTEEILEPYITDNAIYFASVHRVPGYTKSNYNLFRADRLGSVFGAAVPLSEIDTEDQSERMAAVMPDEKMIFWARSVASGEYDIWTANRNTTTEPFANLRKVDELSPAGTNNQPTWISPDGCTLYFMRDWDFWVAHRHLP